MLKKLRIQDYRSCIDTTLELDTNLSVLIGANGSGKTNILNAMMLLKPLVDASERQIRPGAVTSTLGAEFEGLDGQSIDLRAELTMFPNELNSDVLQSVKEHWQTSNKDGSTKTIPVPLLISIEEAFSDQLVAWFRRGGDHIGAQEFMRTKPVNALSEPLKSRLRKIAAFFRGMKYYAAAQFTNPGSCAVAFEIQDDGETITLRSPRQGHTRILYDMYRAKLAGGKSRYDQFIDIVSPHGLGLIEALSFKKVLISSSDARVIVGGKVERRRNKRYLIVPTFRIGKRHLSPNQLSEGTFKTLALLFYVLTTESTALLIEEPEVCIHHGLLASILELIKMYSRDKLVVLTTHSDFVLDRVEPENVHHVTFNRVKGTTVRHIQKTMTAQEYAALRLYLKTEGSLGEYWRTGALTETP